VMPADRIQTLSAAKGTRLILSGVAVQRIQAWPSALPGVHWLVWPSPADDEMQSIGNQAGGMVRHGGASVQHKALAA